MYLHILQIIWLLLLLGTTCYSGGPRNISKIHTFELCKGSLSKKPDKSYFTAKLLIEAKLIQDL